MATCYVCGSEIESIGCAIGTTFVAASPIAGRRAYRRKYAHVECDKKVVHAEIAAVKSDPDFMGFDSDGFPID